MNIKPIARRLGSTEGVEILEAALVLPVVFMLLLGTVWFGRAFNVYSTVQQAAQQGVITAARSTCGTCTSPNALPTPDAVDSAVVAVLTASNLGTGSPPIQRWQPAFARCPAPAPAGLCSNTNHNIWVCSSVLLNSSSQPPQCGSVVSFQYQFTFDLPFTSLGVQPIVMSAQAQSRMEN